MGALLTFAALAQDEPSQWRWSGYYTLGHTQVSSSTVSGFARDQTQRIPGPWLVDTRLGLQVDGRITPSLGLTAQAVLRKRVADNQAIDAVEWAFVHWAPAPDWQLRLGRTSPDLFLFADVRSVGVAYPWVRPNQELYAWVPVQSVDGLDLSRSWANEDATWKLKGSFGHGRLRLSGQDAGVPPADLRVHAVRTLTLSRESATTRLKLSYLRSTVDLTRASGLVALNDLLQQVVVATQPVVPSVAGEALELQRALTLSSAAEYLTVGAQHDAGNWQWIVELNRSRMQAKFNNGERAYASLGRRFDTVTAFTVLGRSRMTDPLVTAPLGWQSALTPIFGPELAAQTQGLAFFAADAANAARVEQRSMGLGLRWDLRANLALKAQLDFVKVARQGGAFWTFKAGAPRDAFSARVFSLTVDGSF